MTGIVSRQTLSVFKDKDITVSEGADRSCGLSDKSDLNLNDLYCLNKTAELKKIVFSQNSKTKKMTITAETDIGVPGSDLHLKNTLTLMTQFGEVIDVFLFTSLEDDSFETSFLCPTDQMDAGNTYSLIGVDTENSHTKLAEFMCAGLAAGTRITTDQNVQVPIETLKVGDMVLTREEGLQRIQGVKKHTVRAVGNFAPVMIRRGVLNNKNDLIVNPNHKLLICKQPSKAQKGCVEMLIKAKDLVNEKDIIRQEGGFIDYFQLVFEAHQIIYAENIATETTLIDTTTKAAFPDELSHLAARHSQSRYMSNTVQKNEYTHNIPAIFKLAAS